ncbi:hypothetical protein ACQEV9_45790 [Streptomyces chartreusis]|uniref:hypothetical protein n=1 Tax=Streptomyces chartreusis TaxID=1969 RepID=UPI003D89FCDD
MNELLKHVVEAHGGFQRWYEITVIRAAVSINGPMWGRRGQEGILSQVGITAHVHQQHLVFTDFTAPGLRGVYTPRRVAVEDLDGNVLIERHTPREAYKGQTLASTWDVLHALYFAGYSMWNYLTTPYLLTHPDVTTEELEPWQPSGERWRRLKAVFPPRIATHSAEQIFSYDESGLLRRHDYAPYVMGDRPVAHRTEAHRTISGLVFPSYRYVLPLVDGRLAPDPVITVDLIDITVD